MINKRQIQSGPGRRMGARPGSRDFTQRISVGKTNHAIHWIVIYPVDSVIHLSNNRDPEVHFTDQLSKVRGGSELHRSTNVRFKAVLADVWVRDLENDDR